MFSSWKLCQDPFSIAAWFSFAVAATGRGTHALARWWESIILVVLEHVEPSLGWLSLYRATGANFRLWRTGLNVRNYNKINKMVRKLVFLRGPSSWIIIIRFGHLHFAFLCFCSDVDRAVTGASEPLRSAAADAICELTENWEPPAEGEGCIYQPLSCALLIFIGYRLQASSTLNFWHVSSIFSQYPACSTSRSSSAAVIRSMLHHQVGGAAARVSRASSCIGGCTKGRAVWLQLMADGSWWLMADGCSLRLWRAFSSAVSCMCDS